MGSCDVGNSEYCSSRTNCCMFGRCGCLSFCSSFFCTFSSRMFVFLIAHSARPINVYFTCCLGLLSSWGFGFGGKNNYLGVGGSLAGWGALLGVCTLWGIRGILYTLNLLIPSCSPSILRLGVFSFLYISPP